MVLKYPSKLFMTMLLFSLVANFSCNSEKKEKEKKQYEEEFWKECTIEFACTLLQGVEPTLTKSALKQLRL